MMTFWIRRHMTFLFVLSMLSLCRVTPLFFPRIPRLFVFHRFHSESLANVPAKLVSKAVAATEVKASISELAGPVVRHKKWEDLTGLPLHSYARDYTYVFQGKVKCGSEGCLDAMVNVHLTTMHDSVAEMVPIQEDGSYRVQLMLKEFPREQADWTLAAFKPQRFPVEVRGRHILLDETSLVVEKNITLP